MEWAVLDEFARMGQSSTRAHTIGYPRPVSPCVLYRKAVQCGRHHLP